MSNLSVVSGGFDPLHPGHIRLIEEASQFGSVIVLLNSDEWLVRKKGACLMTFDDRSEVLMSMTAVSEVLEVDDSDDSVAKTLQELREQETGKIYFCNGGDRSPGRVPEEGVKGVIFEYGVGGDYKIASSSTYLNDYIKAKTNTIPVVKKWGNYVVLYESKHIKAKLLTINPGEGISLQRHKHRREFWVYKSGDLALWHCEKGLFEKAKEASDCMQPIRWKPGETMLIKEGDWHMVGNQGEKPAQIVELQWGKKVSEDDIERLFHFSKRKKYML